MEISPQEILNEIEQEKIIAFMEDPIMREAVKKILLRGIYENGTLKAGVSPEPAQNFLLAIANDKGLSNEQIGQELRSAYWGITILEQAFNKMSELKKEETLEEETNLEHE